AALLGLSHAAFGFGAGGATAPDVFVGRSSAGVLSTSAGGAVPTDARAKLGGTLSVNTTNVGNVGSGEDDLMTYSVPANTLNGNGQRITFRATGTLANNADSKRIRVYFGSDTLVDTGIGLPTDETGAF